MAGLSVIFKAVDEISSKFDAMSSAGTRTLDSFDRIENAANQAFSSVTEETQKTADAMEKATEATDYWTDAVGNYNRDAMQAIWTTEELVDMGYMTEDALNQTADAIDEATDGMKDLGDAAQKTSDEMEDFGDKADMAGKQADDFGDASQDAIIGLDDVLATIGIVAALKTIASAFSECSEAAATFETSVAMVSTVADTTVLSADQLSNQISELSIATAKDVNELADATYNAISAGVATENAVNTVGEATKLATAGFTSSSSALSVLTTAMNAYGLEASEITNISDSLVTSQNLGVLTIDQLASSMGKAISTASAYSVDLYNLESGYISLTKAGISVEESTTYISSMFNELGDAGSDVAGIIADETGKSFGQLMNEGYSLANVLDIVYDAAGRDGEAMMNLWGSAEAGKAANAIINQGLDTFNSNLNKLANSAGTTQAAYEAMTDTTAYGTERMQNSFDNLKIAIGNDLNPVLSEFKNGMADIVDKFTEIVNEHPLISSVLTGIVVGVGAVTLAITSYIAITKIATVVTAAMGTTMTVALGPIGLVAAAIGAVTAAAIYMANAEDDATKAQETLTSSSQEMADELNDLEEQYDALVEADEEDTVAAYQLKNQIEELTYALEENGQTIGDLITLNEEYRSTLDELKNANDDAFRSINGDETDAKSLIAQLASMQKNTELSGNQMQIMQSIVDRLNDSYEGLNLTLDETNGKMNMSIEDLWKSVTSVAEERRAEANMEALMGYLEQYQEFQSVYDEAIQTEKNAKAEYERALEENWADEHPFLAWTGWADGAEMNWNGSVKDTFNVWNSAKEATEGAAANFDELDENIRSCYEAMGYSQEEIDNMMAELALASASATELANKIQEITESVEQSSDGYDEAKTAVESYQEKLQELCEDYDAAYQSALDSIQGQYELWEKADKVTTMSTSSIQTALQSQLDYWNSYNENMDTLTAKTDQIEGLSDMLADLTDGSADSAAMLQGMAKMNDTDLSAVVQQYLDLQSAQSDTATSVADLETEFAEKLNNIQSEMENMVDDMEMSDDAKANAKSTMDAYVNEIEEGVSRAQKAIDSLTFANDTLKSGGYHEYATGTLDAEPGLALVGEEGPELVNFGGGEVVYTADETANILSKDTPNNDFYVAPSNTEINTDTGMTDKTITLRIEGSGEMKVGGNGGVSKEDIVSVLMDNIKDALMNIIQQEIVEEGDLIYDY